ncbi:phage neck terminator protein [Serratia ureilytica]|uniref:Phage neck terminator protein gp12-like domain-containing protein n=1 Tax=Serratia ureilytica TaxID=300181 RepID=A0A9X9G076_9GAMM|nr:hypothetical protein [Serratia ureilytica]TXE22180.1 hypothetical protein FOT63_25700 [Serratia ureilytica]
MSNDSTAPGYLIPESAGPAYDKALEIHLSEWICGVTGINVTLVYPRWTDPQRQIPKIGTTWCAFGITAQQQALNPADVQISDDRSEQWAWERVTVICCFYGPEGAALAARFRAGIFIEQNNAELNRRSGLTLNDAGTLYNVPELINNQWVRRYDLTVTLSRKIVREYNIKSLIATSPTDIPVILSGD